MVEAIVIIPRVVGRKIVANNKRREDENQGCEFEIHFFLRYQSKNELSHYLQGNEPQ